MNRCMLQLTINSLGMGNILGTVSRQLKLIYRIHVDSLDLVGIFNILFSLIFLNECELRKNDGKGPTFSMKGTTFYILLWDQWDSNKHGRGPGKLYRKTPVKRQPCWHPWLSLN